MEKTSELKFNVSIKKNVLKNCAYGVLLLAMLAACFVFDNVGFTEKTSFLTVMLASFVVIVLMTYCISMLTKQSAKLSKINWFFPVIPTILIAGILIDVVLQVLSPEMTDTAWISNLIIVAAPILPGIATIAGMLIYKHNNANKKS
ncbi:MAG: hypothetical protein RR540_07115 [Oscillospiraceae bacterium]